MSAVVRAAPLAVFLLASCSTPDLPSSQTGEVRFTGFAETALTDFRVIPEQGNQLRAPANGTTYPTDGFFFRNAPPGHWYKIPNHCRSSLRPGPGGFTDTPTCDPAGMMIQKLRGQPAEPMFVPQAGATNHPARNPF